MLGKRVSFIQGRAYFHTSRKTGSPFIQRLPMALYSYKLKFQRHFHTMTMPQSKLYTTAGTTQSAAQSTDWYWQRSAALFSTVQHWHCVLCHALPQVCLFTQYEKYGGCSHTNTLQSATPATQTGIICEAF